MSTDFICQVGPGQADYTSLASFIAALPTDLTTAKVFSHGGVTGTISDGDSVTGATSGATATVVHCTSSQIYLHSISGAFQSGEKVYVDANNYVYISDSGDVANPYAQVATNGSADSALTISGITTSSSAKIKIRAATPPKGVWSSGLYRIEGAAYKMLSISVDHVELYGIQIYGTTSGNTYGIYLTGQSSSSEILVDRCIIRFNDNNNSSYWRRGIRTYDTSVNLKVRNTIIYDARNSTNNACAGIYWNGGSAAYIHNCTIHNCYFGIYSTDSTITVKNTITNDCANGFSGSFSANSDYNASDISGDAPGSNSRNGTDGVVTFRDESGDDFHLGSTDSNARGNGTDLSTDANLAVTEDCDGTDLTDISSWNIGADQDIPCVAAVSLSQLNVNGAAQIATEWETSGASTLPQLLITTDSVLRKQYSVSPAVELNQFKVEAATSWTRTGVVYEYETWPLHPEYPWSEIYQYDVLTSPANYGIIKRRARNQRARRSWRFINRNAFSDEAEVFRAFVRDHAGGSRPFYIEVPDVVPRPWMAPTLGVTTGGNIPSQRTLYVGYTWQGVSGETPICYNIDSITVPANYKLTVTVPVFPRGVTAAGVYVGVSANDLKYQGVISESGGTWTEPDAGYNTSGANPPSVNSLSETVLVTLADNEATKNAAGRWTLSATFVELFPATKKAVYGTGYISLPSLSSSASAKLQPNKASAEVTLPTLIAAATARDQTVRGAVTLPVLTSSGSCTSPVASTASVELPQLSVSASASAGLVGDWYVDPSGDDSNPGTSSEPFQTIGRAVQAAQSGETIIVRAGTYNESVELLRDNVTIRCEDGAILETSDTYGIWGDYLTGITIDNLEVTGPSQGIRCYRGDSWTIENCHVHSCSERGIAVIGQNDGWTYYHGSGHVIRNNLIHHIYHNSEAFGIYASRLTESQITGNTIYLCRKEGIRTIRCKGVTTSDNYIFRCWTGISPEEDSSHLTFINNWIIDCDIGVYFKKVTDDIGPNYFTHNTVEDCGIGFWLSSQTPATTGWRIRFNLFKGAYETFAILQAQSGNVLDYNMYWDSNSAWHLWVDDDSYSGVESGQDNSWDSLAELRADTGFEQNGTMYDPSTVDDYGCSGVTSSASEEFTYDPASAIDASSNTSTMQRGTDRGRLSIWKAASDSNEYLIIDLGSTKTINYAFLLPWAHDTPYSYQNPKNVMIKVSTDNLSYTTVASRTNDSKGATHIYSLGDVSARYIRLDITDSQASGYDIWVADFFVGHVG